MQNDFSPKIKTYLDRLAASPKRPNSFLFAGAQRTGKAEAAEYFVSKLAQKTGDAEFLRRFRGKVHPDVVVIEPETVEDKKGRIREKEITASQIREACQRLKFFPYELEKKFCLIKKSQRMNAEASNALLKILEEPTKSTFFILLAGDTDSVLPTISSRCAVLRFPRTELPVWNEENREKFRNIFKEEIFEKFDYIEKISRDKNEFSGILKDWEAVAAEGMRKLATGDQGGGNNLGKMKKVAVLLENIREAIDQLERTNASARAVGEKLMLEMSSG
ncbi:MAG: hypothetical protein A2359_02990 [Candidatus Moranbacteria bacterium RIFOXYB1_FULL_43_19]|nr:MAG: hypothetical protein A2359_02990 [Candidatus Moranbacteria bacterium RIFOXYB1_FULL_43_19]OGI28947.1 MAG: hypothetical protein A2184_00910 [Candidatus Moranbacteria bacterium RIFOXYA1_FULL_44_7]OGI33644.1 MAG: hypothetical protein A2420_02250 [Candidatus Moranbacteria bacterium RIFOXYC1_FULL_44_13]OGI37187.1 MAG: hypothetical protein A2612_03855 [Candidatus Moranbacteria bacterium RIFOXYD1_FULL_44_12]